MKLLSFFLLLLFNFSSNATPPKTTQAYTPKQIETESKRANAFFDNVFERTLAIHPQLAAQLGQKTNYDKWDDLSDAQHVAEMAMKLDDLAFIKREINYDALDAQTKLSYDVFEYIRNREIEGFIFRFDSYPVNQMYGVHTEIPVFLINIHRVDTLADARAYIARVNKVPTVIDQLLVKLQTRAEKGVIPPKFVFPLVLDASRRIISGAPFDDGANTPLLDDFSKKVSTLKGINVATRKKLMNDLNDALLQSFRPAYLKLIAYLEELEKKATEDAGVWKFPDGERFYNFALRSMTTTNLSAEEIHQIGLKEVARIHSEMEVLKKRVAFKGDLQAFFHFMREDKQFYYPDSEEGRAQYLAAAVEVIDEMRSKLDDLFIVKPKAPIVVKAVEKFREKSAGKAFYQRPSLDGSRPGVYYVNLSDMKSTPKYEIEALAYHEGIPGHHMQLAIAQELKGIPEFRKLAPFTAYTEGWGLYNELTPKEIGFYKDPYSDFGRLSMELWRAARLVVDTGLHHKRWPRQQAIDYLKQNTPNAEEDCIDAINRYIVMPGQATAYKIGMLKIMELREMAKDRLGKNFDIREFHDLVLTNGPLPLEMLEKQVNRWINERK